MPNGVAQDHGVVSFQSRLPWYYGHIDSLAVSLLVKSQHRQPEPSHRPAQLDCGEYYEFFSEKVPAE